MKIVGILKLFRKNVKIICVTGKLNLGLLPRDENNVDVFL